MTEATTTPESEAPVAAPMPAPTGKDAGTEKGNNAKIWMGTAVGVGSAALVAALMYAKRRK